MTAPKSVAEPTTMKSPIGENSRPLRFIIVALVVVVYTSVGLYLHLNLAEYQLLGIPVLLIFQIGIHRQPLRTLWVRSGPPLRLNSRFFSVWALFSVFPAYEVASFIMHSDLSSASLWSVAIAGAFGLSYALNNTDSKTMRYLALSILTVDTIGIAPTVLQFVGHHASHIISLPPILEAGVSTILFLPTGFLVEEVFFRGALDTYLHRGEKGTGWMSAIFVSALWGLWHLPGHAILPGHLLSTLIALLVAQIIVGVPLSYWWRKSGNLTVNDTAHAILDTVRNILAVIA